MRKITRVIIHHTVTSRDSTVADIDRMHKNRNWGSASIPYWASKSSLGYYAQYHYLITADGKVTQCQEEKTASWHAGNANFDSIGVCMTGNFDNEMPSKEQQASLRELLLEKGLSIQLHRDVKATACPGKNITMEWVNNLLSETMYKIDSKLRNAIEAITETSYDDKMGSEKVQEEAAGDLNGAWEFMVKDKVGLIDENAKLSGENTKLNDSIEGLELEYSKNNNELIIENKAIEKQNNSITNQLNTLKLTSAEEVRGLRDQLIKRGEELEECIEDAQCPVIDYTWEKIAEIILKKLNINMKK